MTCAIDPGGPPRSVAVSHPRLADIERAVRAVQADPENNRVDVGSDLRKIGVMGSARVVFRVPAGGVVKVEMWSRDDADSQNAAELSFWKTCSRSDALLLCPILAAGKGWLVMPEITPYADSIEEGEAPMEELLAAPFRHITDDLYAENFGWHCDRLVLLDYGRPKPPSAARLQRAVDALRSPR